MYINPYEHKRNCKAKSEPLKRVYVRVDGKMTPYFWRCESCGVRHFDEREFVAVARGLGVEVGSA